MKNIINKRYSGVALLFVILYFLICPSLTFAQKLTHIVQKGDTLWGICEQYYGDPGLWPKLWEMNPFITNPHLLKAGDEITLFEQEPAKEEIKKAQAVEEKAPVKKVTIEAAKPMGIDIASLIKVDARGYLSYEEIDAWGRIISSDSDKIMLIEGDIAYVLFDETRVVNKGDQFFIGASSKQLKNPLTGKDLGYAFSVHGRLTIEETLGLAIQHKEFTNKKNVFKARIDEAYSPVNIEDTLVPYTPFASTCILPVSLDTEIQGNIIAAKDQGLLIQPYSIVYINLGTKNGLKMGNIMNVVQANLLPDPDPAEGFQLRSKTIILPDRFLGRVLIIECGEDISTAMVLSVVEPFSPGAYVTNLSWKDTPGFLSNFTTCPVK